MILWIPMGGSGKRFVDAGYTIPKPLLELGGKKLVQHALSSLAGVQGTMHYSPTLELAMHPLLVGLLPPGCWHVVLEPTSGPLQTLLEGKGCLEHPEELLIMDCDSVLDAKELADAVSVFRRSGAEGGVTIRRTTDPMCSYATVDNEWWVEETREKDAFSPWSTTGPYWFRSAKQFLVAAEKAAHAHHVSINPVYNYLDGRTKAVPVASFRHFGTPEAYEAAKQETAQWTTSVPFAS